MANEGITALRIVGLTSLDEAYDLAGIEGSLQNQDDLRAKVNTFLGTPQTFDDVAMIPGPALSESVSQQANTASPFNLRVVSRIYKVKKFATRRQRVPQGQSFIKTEASGYYGYSVSATTGYGISCTKHLRIENVF